MLLLLGAQVAVARPAPPPPPLPCGNGTVDPGEDCDDGNTVGGDGCSEICLFEPDSGVPGDASAPDAALADATAPDGSGEDAAADDASSADAVAAPDAAVDSGVVVRPDAALLDGGSADQGLRADASAVADASSVDAGQGALGEEDAGCSCRAGPSTRGAPWGLLALLIGFLRLGTTRRNASR